MQYAATSTTIYSRVHGERIKIYIDHSEDFIRNEM